MMYYSIQNYRVQLLMETEMHGTIYMCYTQTVCLQQSDSVVVGRIC